MAALFHHVASGRPQIGHKAIGRGETQPIQQLIIRKGAERWVVPVDGDQIGQLVFGYLSGIATKGLFMAPRDGCPTPRIVETPSGLLNAIGLQGVGVRHFVSDVLPRLRECGTGTVPLQVVPVQCRRMPR